MRALTCAPRASASLRPASYVATDAAENWSTSAIGTYSNFTLTTVNANHNFSTWRPRSDFSIVINIPSLEGEVPGE